MVQNVPPILFESDNADNYGQTLTGSQQIINED